MEYTLIDVMKKIESKIDALYLFDRIEKTYITIKDNDLWHQNFGDTGSSVEMISKFIESSLDKEIEEHSPYSIFSGDSAMSTGNIAYKAKIRMSGQDIIVSIWSIPIDEKKTALLVVEEDSPQYSRLGNTDQQISAMKSVYLFSMMVDLNANKCGSMNLSEIDGAHVNQQVLDYSTWRGMISNMFLPEDQGRFMEITAPEYLRDNLNYRNSSSVECQMRNLEGKFIWVRLIFKRINTGNDEDFRFIFMVENIHDSHTKLMNDLERLEHLVKKDSLTGLLNYGSIDAEIGKSISAAKVENRSVSLIMFDADHFKTINDTYGHAIGDYVLKALSDIANEYIISNGGKLGRWGGEEFIGVCENVTVEKMESIAEQLRVKIADYYFDNVGKVTCSFGVIEVDKQENVETAFKRIDAALYQAKNSGRNKVVVG